MAPLLQAVVGPLRFGESYVGVVDDALLVFDQMRQGLQLHLLATGLLSLLIQFLATQRKGKDMMMVWMCRQKEPA